MSNENEVKITDNEIKFESPTLRWAFYGIGEKPSDEDLRRVILPLVEAEVNLSNIIREGEAMLEKSIDTRELVRKGISVINANLNG